MNKNFVIVVSILSVLIIGLVMGLSLIFIYPLANVNTTGNMTDNSLILNETESNGIALAMSPLNTESQSKIAYNITATVNPSDAVNQKLNWDIKWSDTTSSWANGKNVNDYITMTIDESTKVATVSCNQPFGSQVIIKASAQEDADISASCTLDYSQKVSSASLNIGNIAVNLGGSTNIKYEIATGVKGSGGMIQANYVTEDVYSLAENYTVSVKVEIVEDAEGNSIFLKLKGNNMPTGINYHTDKELNGTEVYYDYDHDIEKWFIMRRTGGDIKFNSLSKAEIADYFSQIEEPTLYKVVVTLTGQYNTYTYSSIMKVTGCVNNTKVSDVSFANGNYVF